MKGQIIIIAVVLMTAVFVIMLTLGLLSTNQLSIAFDISGGTKAIVAADQALDCYFFIEAGEINTQNFGGEGKCNKNCTSNSCEFMEKIKFRFETSTIDNQTIIHGYGIFGDSIFRVLEAREVIY
jgi:hypothetical protein